MLSLIIHGEESITRENMDTYLEPLLEELHFLWHEQVHIHDAANYNGASQFTLRTIVMWCMHDFLAFSIVASYVTKGYHACPKCGPHTSSHYSRAMSKTNCNHHQYLPMDHQFQENIIAFDGTREIQMVPPQMEANDVLQWGYVWGTCFYKKEDTFALMT